MKTLNDSKAIEKIIDCICYFRINVSYELHMQELSHSEYEQSSDN